MTVYRNYDDIRPTEYYYEYYSRLNKENIFLLESISEALKKIPFEKNNSIIELGGGISLLPLIPLSLVASEIYFTDVSNLNLKMVEDWKNNKEFLNWDLFFKKFLEINETNDNYEYKKETLRRKIKDIFFLDLKSFTFHHFQKYDIISSHFVSECISEFQEEFEFIFQNMLQLLKDNGYFIGSFYLRGHYLRIGRSNYKILFLEEDFVINIFLKLNFEIVYFNKIDTIFHNGYQEILFIVAKRKEIRFFSEDAYSLKLNDICSFLGIIHQKESVKKIVILGFINKHLLYDLSRISLFNKKIDFYHQFEKYLYTRITIETKKKEYKLLLYGNRFFAPVELFDLINDYVKFWEIELEYLYLDILYLKNKEYYLIKFIKKINKFYNISDFHKNFLLFTPFKDENQLGKLVDYKNYFFYNQHYIFSLVLLGNLEKIKKFLQDFSLHIPKEEYGVIIDDSLFTRKRIDLLGDKHYLSFL